MAGSTLATDNVRETPLPRSLLKDVSADLAAHGIPPTAWVLVLWLLLCRPGLLAQLVLRVQQAFYRHHSTRPFAFLLRSLNHVLTGADFVPGCEIGPGLRIEHPNGIVVGTKAVVGRNAFLCQRVTLGERLGIGRGAAYPSVGDGVFIGTGATLLGAIDVGDRARIGAGAVVLCDVPAEATAEGNPARVARAADPDQGDLVH